MAKRFEAKRHLRKRWAAKARARHVTATSAKSLHGDVGVMGSKGSHVAYSLEVSAVRGSTLRDRERQVQRVLCDVSVVHKARWSP